MSARTSKRRLLASATALGLMVAAGTSTATTASAMPIAKPAAAAKQPCSQVPYSDRTQAKTADGRPNAAGVVFQAEGDVFKVWDNVKDGKRVAAYFNYAGVDDKWKFVLSPVDGRGTSVIRNLNERYKHICFGVWTHGPDSPIVRHTTRP